MYKIHVYILSCSLLHVHRVSSSLKAAGVTYVKKLELNKIEFEFLTVQNNFIWLIASLEQGQLLALLNTVAS